MFSTVQGPAFAFQLSCSANMCAEKADVETRCNENAARWSCETGRDLREDVEVASLAKRRHTAKSCFQLFRALLCISTFLFREHARSSHLVFLTAAIIVLNFWFSFRLPYRGMRTFAMQNECIPFT